MTELELTTATREAARAARMHLQRIGDDGGLLHQIETGEAATDLNVDLRELHDLITSIAARARLDRLYLYRLMNGL